MEGGYQFLLDLALILLSTKLLGLLTKRFQLPQVVGALLAGLILGPAVLNVIHETEFIKETAEVGVIVMMFCAGMETDVNELKHSGKAAFVIALIGVLVPIAGGFGLLYGALCAIPYFFMGGLAAAISYWIYGIPFDLIHGISNVCIMLLLWKPMGKVFARLEKLIGRS